MIPPMIEPLGKHWQQPDPKDIELTEKTATMSEETFNRLLNYSSTFPTGTYVGKMWKRGGGRTEEQELLEYAAPGYLEEVPPNWWLCWYADHPEPGQIAIHYREIVLR